MSDGNKKSPVHRRVGSIMSVCDSYQLVFVALAVLTSL